MKIKSIFLFIVSFQKYDEFGNEHKDVAKAFEDVVAQAMQIKCNDL